MKRSQTSLSNIILRKDITVKKISLQNISMKKDSQLFNQSKKNNIFTDGLKKYHSEKKCFTSSMPFLKAIFFLIIVLVCLALLYVSLEFQLQM